MRSIHRWVHQKDGKTQKLAELTLWDWYLRQRKANEMESTSVVPLTCRFKISCRETLTFVVSYIQYKLSTPAKLPDSEYACFVWVNRDNFYSDGISGQLSRNVRINFIHLLRVCEFKTVPRTFLMWNLLFQYELGKVEGKKKNWEFL